MVAPAATRIDASCRRSFTASLPFWPPRLGSAVLRRPPEFGVSISTLFRSATSGVRPGARLASAWGLTAFAAIGDDPARHPPQALTRRPDKPADGLRRNSAAMPRHLPALNGKWSEIAAALASGPASGPHGSPGAEVGLTPMYRDTGVPACISYHRGRIPSFVIERAF